MVTLYEQLLDPKCAQMVLNTFARHQNVEIRVCVAKNPSTPSYTLDQLAHDPELAVRQAVNENPNAPKWCKSERFGCCQ